MSFGTEEPFHSHHHLPSLFVDQVEIHWPIALRSLSSRACKPDPNLEPCRNTAPETPAAVPTAGPRDPPSLASSRLSVFEKDHPISGVNR